jgi:hypothetical protein
MSATKSEPIVIERTYDGWGTARWAGPVRVQRTELFKAPSPQASTPSAYQKHLRTQMHSAR